MAGLMVGFLGFLFDRLVCSDAMFYLVVNFDMCMAKTQRVSLSYQQHCQQQLPLTHNAPQQPQHYPQF